VAGQWCGDLSRFHETADIGSGFVLLVGLDGIVRGYGPLKPELMGTDLSRAPGFRPALSLPEDMFSADAPEAGSGGSSVSAVWSKTIWSCWPAAAARLVDLTSA
jgi:hypothetical protein